VEATLVVSMLIDDIFTDRQSTGITCRIANCTRTGCSCAGYVTRVPLNETSP